MKNYDAYVGIDFGTSGTTFSYWLPKTNLAQGNISVKKWEGIGTANKMETEIILDKNFEVVAFGRGACSNFVKNSNEKYFYFSNVKMYLYKNEKEITDNYSNEKYPLNKVISKFLEKIRDEAIKEIGLRQNSFQNKSFEDCLDSIRWIITVPAIWSEQNKACMIEASKLAKLIKDTDDISNFFALEPEAAACFYSMSDKAEKEILDNPYIICDIGGGTTDITTHERIKDEEGKYNINELYPPSGGAHGSREINKYILEEILVKKIFTQEAYDKIQEKIKQNNEDADDLKYDMIKINDEINNYKESFGSDEIKTNKISLEAFKEGFDEEPNIEELVKKYNDNIKEDWKIGIKSKKKWTLELPYKIINDLLQELIVDKAASYINKIINYLKNRKKDKKEIKSVILAGGASANLSIFELFKKALPNLTVVVCDEPEIAVVKGAIHFAKNPYTISKRIARFSLGIKSVDDWGERYEKIPGAIKIGDEKNNLWFCQNVFSVYYRKNRPINTNAEGKKFIFDMNSNHASIEFYKSDFDGPIYVVGQKDEKGNELTKEFGSLQFSVDNFDINDTGVEIEIKLGGTSISAIVKYLKTGEQRNQTFSFD